MWDFEKHKEKIAIITEEEKITYNDLNNFQREFAYCINSGFKITPKYVIYLQKTLWQRAAF